MERSVGLSFASRAYLRLVGSALLLTGLIYVVARGLARTYRTVHQLAGGELLDLPPWLAGPHPHPFQVLASPMTLVCLVGSGLACALLWLRQPRGARITWGDEGITEWDGAGVRTAIRWAEAKRSLLNVVVKRKSGGRYHGGSVEQISDDHGRRITRSMSTWTTPLFLYRRRCECPEIPIPGPTRKGEGIVPDEATRRPRWAIWPLRLGYAVAGLAAFGMEEHARDITGNGLILLVAAVLIGLRALRPVVELRRLGAAGGVFAGATPVELIGNEGSLVVVRDPQGREAVFDPAPLHHDDALLHTRRGPAFLDFTPPAEGGAGTYRGGRAFVEAHALELHGNRQARRDLRRAVGLELLVRLGIAAAFLAGALLLLGIA